jgi:hypothetical protein
MEYHDITYDVRGYAAWITINRGALRGLPGVVTSAFRGFSSRFVATTQNTCNLA